jgi:hypothetical protein
MNRIVIKIVMICILTGNKKTAESPKTLHLHRLISAFESILQITCNFVRMIQRIYVDTSVIGGCFDEEFSYGSNILIDEFKSGAKICVFSDLTLDELENAPLSVRSILDRIPDEYKEFIILDDEAKHLSQLYLDEKAVSEKFREDAEHIAIATINRIDVLVSWNFKHIVNLNRIRIFNAVNLKYGYPELEIRSPLEILNI